jgi:hypothetical protein
MVLEQAEKGKVYEFWCWSDGAGEQVLYGVGEVWNRSQETTIITTIPKNGVWVYFYFLHPDSIKGFHYSGLPARRDWIYDGMINAWPGRMAKVWWRLVPVEDKDLVMIMYTDMVMTEDAVRYEKDMFVRR